MDTIQLAVAAVVEIARYERDADGPNFRPINLKTLCHRFSEQPRRLETQFQTLARAGILRSVRGPLGGYQLAAPANTITAGSIVSTLRASEVVSIPNALAKCPEVHVVLSEFQHAASAEERHLAGVSIATLAARIPRRKRAA